MNFFGKKKESKKPSTTASSTSGGAGGTKVAANSVVTLREAINTQDKREVHIQKKIDAMVAEAKAKMAKKDKKGALFAMKRKKMYEAEIDKIQNTKMTLETQVMALESATQNMETFAAMKSGTNAMKKIRQDADVDNVDDLMDDIKEEMEIANEIGQAMSQPVDPLMYGDDDDLLAELGELEQEDLETELLKKPGKISEEPLDLPSVPTVKLPAASKQEEEDAAALKALEAEIAGM